MQLTGKIQLIKDTVVVSDKFSKRELVIKTGDKYPQDIILQFTQDKCGVLNAYKLGDDVTIDFNIKGREYKGNYFNTLEGWRIQKSNNNSKVNITDMGSEFRIDSHDDMPF